MNIILTGLRGSGKTELGKILSAKLGWNFIDLDEEIEKFRDVLVDGVGLKVVAIADHDTPFETIRVPAAGDMKPYVLLCAGWNLLVEIGLALKINLDKPERARKVGNEFIS